MTKHIVARAIIEIMGSPKEHIEQAIKIYVDKIEKERSKIKIKKKYISDAEEREDVQMFSVFAELDLDCEDISELMWFCFDYMPASIEIISPDNISFDSVLLTEFLNDLQLKLHKTDGLAKTLRAQNTILSNNAVMLMKNLIRLSLKDGQKNLEELANNCGVPAKDLDNFLDSLVKEKKIKKEKNLYSLIK